MADKRKMTLDELELLMRSLQREFKQDPSKFSGDREGSFFYNNSATTHVYMFYAEACGSFWPSIGKVEYDCKKPNIFNRDGRRRWAKIEEMMVEITTRGQKFSSVEAAIIAAIPCAQDILVENTLVENDDD
jgi:hypothetical protein